MRSIDRRALKVSAAALGSAAVVGPARATWPIDQGWTSSGKLAVEGACGGGADTCAFIVWQTGDPRFKLAS